MGLLDTLVASRMRFNKTLMKHEKRPPPHSLYVPSMGSGSGYSWRHFSNYVKCRQIAPRASNRENRQDRTEEAETHYLCDKWAFLFADGLRAASNPTVESRKGPPPQMPKIVVVLGMQSGDEGVEMLMQLLEKDADVVCKSQGTGQRDPESTTDGCNWLPNSIMNPKCKCLLGNGMAVDLLKILEEGRKLESRGVKDWMSRLIISDRAHAIFPAPNDSMEGSFDDEEHAYGAKALRVGLRAGDLLDRETSLTAKVSGILKSHKRQSEDQDLEEVPKDALKFMLWWKTIKDSGITSSIRDSMQFLEQSLRNPGVNTILVEGVEPNLRDVDFGNYPDVSPVNSSIGGVFTGLGVSMTGLKAVYGVLKPFVTRRDNGPFPTEIINHDEHPLLVKGNSKIRVGWLDIPSLQHAQRINGFDALAITNLEALDDLDEILVGMQYRLNGKWLKGYPASSAEIGNVNVLYQGYAGWETSVKDCSTYDDLPLEARHFVEDLEKQIGTRIQWVGVDANQSKFLLR